MSDNSFQPLFDYMDERFSKLESRFDGIEEKIDTQQASTDNLTKMTKDFQDEHIILRHKVERLEAWAKAVSAKVGVPLPQGLLSD